MNTLDEATFNYMDLKLTETKDRTMHLSSFFAADVENSFKAGALWMAKQHADEISECTEKSFNEGVKYAVDNAVEWLSKHFDINVYEEIGGKKVSEILTYDFKSIDNMAADFKKFMEE